MVRGAVENVKCTAGLTCDAFGWGPWLALECRQVRQGIMSLSFLGDAEVGTRLSPGLA
jgi:hypothetical protein